jgi:hypothetical protein
MAEFKKVLSQTEIQTGTLQWSEIQEKILRKVIPQTLVFDLACEGKRFDNLTADWEKRQLYIGEPLMRAPEGSEIQLSLPEKTGTLLSARIAVPAEKMIVRKRLSLNELKHRQLKWYVREDEIYRRLLPQETAFAVEIMGKVTPNRQVDFDKRTLMIGEALKAFTPGDILLIHRVPDAPVTTLAITREQLPSDISIDAMTSLRALITRLLSRPLHEFNDGEVKGLIALLDENKSLWERLMGFREENEKLKEQVATLENVFDQFARNTFFTCKRDFFEWVINHITLFEKGLRILHRDYSVTGEDGKKRRLDLLCQDRKGILVVVEIMYSPAVEELEGQLSILNWLESNMARIGSELTKGLLEAKQMRVLVIANREKPDLVEFCLQNKLKLCVVNCGMVVDVIE